MLGTPTKPPKVVTIRVNRAVGLRNTYLESKKRRKDNPKWKVKIKGGKKKIESYVINDSNGNPTWDFEATIEIADVSQPIVIKVTDSDGHHIGQVVIPLITISPRPIDSSIKPASPSNLRVAELEPTRKISQVYGSLYYWIWAESFYDGGAPEKSSRSSVLSAGVHRSGSRISAHLHRRRDIDDGASAAGSTLSMYSTSDEKKKHWYKRNPLKRIKNGRGSSHLGAKDGSELGYSMSASMGALFPSSNDKPYFEDKDGSVLGEHWAGGSTSDIHDLKDSPKTLDTCNVSMAPNEAQQASAIPKRPATLPKLADEPPLAVSSDEGEDLKSQPPAVNSSVFPMSKDPPSLLSITPAFGSPVAETEVHIYGKNLTEDVMRHAVVLVDEYTVGNYKWSIKEGSWPNEPTATHMVTVRVPAKGELSGGKAWIEFETMSNGRLRCPVPFVYENLREAEVDIKNMQPQPAMPPHVPSGFARNSSVRLSDSRSRRSARPKPAADAAVPVVVSMKPKISPPSSELGTGGGMSRTSSIRLSEKRSRLNMRGSNPAPAALPSFGEVPPVCPPTRSSGFGSEVSSAAVSPRIANNLSDVRIASLADAEEVISKLRVQISELSSELSQKEADVDYVSADLCRLRMKLLEDGLLKYLEKT